MKVKGIDCGCDSRRDIMFTHGGLTVKHVAVLIAVGVAIYIVGRKA